MLRPRARPDDVKPVSGGSTKERSGGGGGGKGGDMATSREQIDRSMNDKRFGYYDPYTGRKVSALIDMINGGGMNAAGPSFEGGPYSGILNAIGVTPYGQENARMGMPEGSYRGGKIDDAMRFNFGGPTVSAMSSGGVSDMRPRARPEMVSRNNAEPINAYGVVPALPSRNNAEPVGPYGLMSVPAVPETYVNPYSVGGGFRETAPLPMNSRSDSIADIFDRGLRYQKRPTDNIDADPRILAELKLNSMFQDGGPAYGDDQEMTNQDYLALLPPVPPKPVSGMPTPMPTQSRFGPDGPQTAEDFAVIHGQIQRDLGILPSQLFDMISNDPDQYDRLISMYSRYGGYEMPRSITPQPAAKPSGQSLRDVVRSAYSATPFSASSLF